MKCWSRYYLKGQVNTELGVDKQLYIDDVMRDILDQQDVLDVLRQLKYK